MWDVPIGTVVTHFADSFYQTQISFHRHDAASTVIRSKRRDPIPHKHIVTSQKRKKTWIRIYQAACEFFFFKVMGQWGSDSILSLGVYNKYGGVIYVMCGNHICEVSKSFSLMFHTNFQVSLFWLLLPTHCRCRGLFSLLIIHNDSHNR